VLQHVTQAVKSADGNVRRGTQFTCFTSTKVQILTQLRYAGGLYVMGICTEHCCESYTEMLDMLMPLLLAGLRDSNKEVTYADVC
jgi:nicotinamidase-related amidase